MGAWNASIYGNDTAQDLKSEYQVVFFYNDVETALAKIDAYIRQEGFDETDEEEWCDYYYSLADFMWKHGILTDNVRDRAVSMIDTGFGLELWADAGANTLEKRQKVLEVFRAKLLSPQPQAKKIKINRYLKPVFNTGDQIAVQLQTANKHYLKYCCISEEEFRNYDGKYVVFRKVSDKINNISSIEPKLKEYWALFQLYGKIFDTCPTTDDLQGIPWADPAKSLRQSQWAHLLDNEIHGLFLCESSMFYFKKRKFEVIGTDVTNLPTKYSRYEHIFLGINSPHANTDTQLINIILG